MLRLRSFFAFVATAGLLLAGGCPSDSGGGGGGGNLPPGDPNTFVNALLTLESTVSILQRNLPGATNPVFDRSSVLTARLVNVDEPGAFTITWQITALGASGFLSFSSSDGAAVLTATGPQVTVFAINSPASAARYRIDALAVSSETSLSSSLQIEVQPDPISAAGDSTVLSVNPFADPPVGFDTVNGVNQVTLLAGDSGPLTRTSFLWEPLDPASIPPGLILPEVVERDNSTLVLTVAGDVTGVFPFRVSVTDSIGTIQTGVVNVYLGITELTLDVQVQQVLPVSSAVTMQSVRAGGASDVNSGVDDAFTYNWAAFDANGAPVPVDVFPENSSSDTNPATLDANLIDWRITGLAAPATYRLDCTVEDRAGNTTTTSVIVPVTDSLALTVGSTRTQTGPGAPFSLRTIRTAGTGPFTYTFLVLDSNGNDVTEGSGLAISPSNSTQTTWPVNGQSPEVYHFFVTVRDGNEKLATAATTITVTDDLTLAVEAGRTQVGANSAFSLRTIRDGGRPNFTYSFLVLDQSGADVTGGTGLATTGDNDADNTWNVAGQAAGTYRFFVTATDGDGRQTSGSTTVLVGDVLSLNLVGDTSIAAPGVPVRFRAQARGGVAPYTFAFSAFDAEGDDPIGDVFSTVTINGQTGVATYVSSADSASIAQGGYRIRANVTDALGNTSGAVTSLFITSNQDMVASARILNPPAPSITTFEPGITFNTMGGGVPDGTANFVPAVQDPSLEFARSLSLRITDNDGSGLDVSSISFIGTNQRGEVVTDAINNPALGSIINTLTTPFKRLDRVTVTYTGAANQDTIEIGIGDRLGLPRPFSTVSEAAADRSFTIVASGANLDTAPEGAVFIDPINGLSFQTVFALFPDRQSVQFPLAPPNGANDYIVQYVPMNAITVGVIADDLSLDVSDGDVANVGIAISGGLPPYSIDYADLGSRTADNVSGASFNPPGPLNTQFTGAIVQYTPPTVTNTQRQTLRVLVTDSTGETGVGFVTIDVVP